ncbi:MAG: aminoacyl-tRNA hydrolase [Alphaproteobacteria bacterium TMED62]|nr:MAG: aminoacyl-tRNA hydrolase [Alphaproteobacteria bacterium TMED62]|tara:strand:+ start:9589 stop:10146 length:558 start_codon:yes stop_codon:yes gene_type:complete
MFLFVGLGNKGTKYKYNRHNVGFLLIDYLVKEYGFLKINNKFKSVLYKGNILDYNVILSKPETMMNLSGEAIILIKKFYKVEQNNIFVFHDELDLNLGKIKFKFGGSSAGHNGIKNIDKNVGNEYYRIRIGINKEDNKYKSDKFVLSDFKSMEKVLLNSKIELINDNIKYIFKKNISKFMNEINK